MPAEKLLAQLVQLFESKQRELFVAGKYGISPASAGGFQEMLDVADYLIEQQ